MSPSDWHDINSPGHFLTDHLDLDERVEPEQPDTDQQPPEDTSPHVRLFDPVFVEPDEGFEPNKPCTLRVSGELLRADARKTVLFTVYSKYGDNEPVNEYVKHDAVLRNGVAELEIPYLPLNEQYHRDKNKPEDAAYEVWFEVAPLKYGDAAESEPLVLPVAASTDAGMIFFAPGRGANGEGEYFEIEESDLDALGAHVEEMDTLATEISELRRLFESGDESALQKAELLEEKVKKQLQGLTANPAHGYYRGKGTNRLGRCHNEVSSP